MIHLQNLRLSYPGPDGQAAPVLALREWRAARGEQLALVGGSGSGKTTLLNLISGLLKPDQGVVEVAGTDLATLGEARRDRFRADHIGYVFQSFHLLDGFSARENVELGAVFAQGKPEPGRAAELLEAVGLGHRMNHPPSKLSVGQQARVSLARALMNKPEVLLADEPTGSLDADNAAQVLALLRDTAEAHNITLICATHDMEVAGAFPRCDRVEDLA